MSFRYYTEYDSALQTGGASLMELEQMSAPVRPMRADALRNRARVLDAARKLFATDEPDPSMERIARAAGVGVGTMYRNWPSRSDLVEEVYRDNLAGLAAFADELEAEQAPWDALEQWLRAYLTHAQSRRGMLAELTASFDARPDLRSESRRQVLHAAETVLEPAQGAGVVRSDLTAADLIQLVSGMVLPALTDPSRSPYLLDVVLAGIRI
jgi:AcrR family transcriptional regulator